MRGARGGRPLSLTLLYVMESGPGDGLGRPTFALWWKTPSGSQGRRARNSGLKPGRLREQELENRKSGLGPEFSDEEVRICRTKRVLELMSRKKSSM